MAKRPEEINGIESVGVNVVLNTVYIDYVPGMVLEEEIEAVMKRTGCRAVKKGSMDMGD